jgi:hypothetical protein
MNKEELKARLQKGYNPKPSFWLNNFPKVFTAVGILMLAICLGIATFNYSFIKDSEKTTGVVIGLDGGLRRQGYAPVVQYSDLNQTVHTYYHSVFSRPPQYQIGDVVDIYYLKDEPSNASMGYSLLGIAVTGGLGVLFLFFGFIFQKAFKF